METSYSEAEDKLIEGESIPEEPLSIINRAAMQSFVVSSGCGTLGVVGMAAEAAPVAVIQLKMLSDLSLISGRGPLDEKMSPALIIKLISINAGIQGAMGNIQRAGVRYIPGAAARILKKKKVAGTLRYKMSRFVPVAGAFACGYINYAATRKLGARFLNNPDKVLAGVVRDREKD